MPQDKTESRSEGAAETRKATLDELRHRIDGLDEAILELVEKRVAAAREIAELKKGDSDSRLRLRPAREAAVVERLVARAKEAPEGLVRQIWREIMSSCLDLQVHTDLVIHAPSKPAAITDATRRRFGCAGRMVVVGTPAEAVRKARTREAVAVIEISSDCDWWIEVMHDAALAPFECLRDQDGRPIAVAVGRIAAEDLLACPDIRIVNPGEPLAGELLATCGDLKLVLMPDDAEREAAR